MKLNLPRTTTCYSLGRTNSFRAASHSLFENKSMGFEGFGSNLQNIPDNLRQIYKADDGYKLAQVDQAGAEARIVAYLAEDGLYRDLFRCGISPHSYVCLSVLFTKQFQAKAPDLDIQGAALLRPKDLIEHPQFKSISKLLKSSDKWMPKERYYFMGKMTAHAANYGIKAPTFMLNVLQKSEGQIALSKRDAEFFLASYRATFPEIVKWNIKTYEEYLKHHTLYNMFGHPRYFTSDEDAEKVYAFVPQSTVGEITHMAIRDTQIFIEEYKKDWHILQNNHDSFLMEFPPTEEAEAVKVMRDKIEIGFVAPDGSKFNMKSEAKVGYNWKDLEEIKL